RYSVLPAISYKGILSTKVVKGSFNMCLFMEFIQGLVDRMQPVPAKNSVIVMDNCKIHKNPAIRELVQEWYVIISMHLLY
ncbi:hypothetical protein K439DRAFT_1371383, partial [Ramaria rubella]